MGVERVTLADGLAVEAVQLALITLIQVLVGVVEHQAPGVFRQQVEPGTQRARQAFRRIAQVAQRITLAAHARLGHLVRRLLGCAGSGQAGQLQLQVVQRLQCRGQVRRRAAVVIQ
ncbi:hypothetical protein D3C79_815540 [compost metagenome]